jgi:hypothetical protein
MGVSSAKSPLSTIMKKTPPVKPVEFFYNSEKDHGVIH